MIWLNSACYRTIYADDAATVEELTTVVTDLDELRQRSQRVFGAGVFSGGAGGKALRRTVDEFGNVVEKYKESGGYWMVEARRRVDNYTLRMMRRNFSFTSSKTCWVSARSFVARTTRR